jgi:hypothetical protein
MNDKIIKGDVIKNLLFENKQSSGDIVVTLPSTISWVEYEKELQQVADGKNVINFKVPNFPTKTSVGDKCYICHKGFVVGFMEIVGLETKKFKCSTTGKEWNGNFIERTGPFTYLKEPLPMKGFQGFKYYNYQ